MKKNKNLVNEASKKTTSVSPSIESVRDDVHAKILVAKQSYSNLRQSIPSVDVTIELKDCRSGITVSQRYFNFRKSLPLNDFMAIIRSFREKTSFKSGMTEIAIFFNGIILQVKDYEELGEFAYEITALAAWLEILLAR